MHKLLRHAPHPLHHLIYITFCASICLNASDFRFMHLCAFLSSAMDDMWNRSIDWWWCDDDGIFRKFAIQASTIHQLRITYEHVQETHCHSWVGYYSMVGLSWENRWSSSSTCLCILLFGGLVGNGRNWGASQTNQQPLKIQSDCALGTILLVSNVLGGWYAKCCSSGIGNDRFKYPPSLARTPSTPLSSSLIMQI